MKTLPGTHLSLDNSLTRIVYHQRLANGREPLNLRCQSVSEVVLAERIDRVYVVPGCDSMNDADTALGENLVVYGSGTLTGHH
jgi:hypothetical protein